MKRILVIQTAFIGDVILATPILEKLHQFYSGAQIDILVRKGNESLFEGHPFLHEVIVWNKKSGKYRQLLKVLKEIRKKKYDLIINPQRFLSTGFLTVFSKAKYKIGFSKNPLSFLFSKRLPHQFGTGSAPIHEVERNLSLIAELTDNQRLRPKLYPSQSSFDLTKKNEKYITISPGSVWFTKQFPAEKWIEFIDRVGEDTTVYLLGGKGEIPLCNLIREKVNHDKIIIKAGEFSFLESAALMKGASMNFTNDSAPTHLATAVNAPVTTIFCSTLPSFGFTPLSDNSHILEYPGELKCRPCGLHGKKNCPENHFRCSQLNIEMLLEKLK